MQEPLNSQGFSFPAPGGDPRRWLAQYLRNRAGLAAYKSDFQCDPACTRPGCKNLDIQVAVSLVDLLGAALHRGEPVSVTFQGRYTLGVFANGREDLIRMVDLKVKKPCPFLKEDLCSIYPVRPLPCALFPEYLVSAGTLAAQAGQESFRDYLCLHRPLTVSPDRAKVLGKLQRMWERESIISSYYLFGHGPCYLDFSNLAAELLEESGKLQDPEGDFSPGPQPPGYIPHSVLDRVFQERIVRSQPFADVTKKVNDLDQADAQLHFLKLLQDDRLHRKLLAEGEDRALVFRFVKGKLRAKRRSLLPPEYKFY